MSMIGNINCIGRSRVPYSWNYNNHKGINRLYFIHDGEGAYFDGGERHLFVPGLIYYFPHMADFCPDREACAGMLHTYADFELIPPIVSDKVIEFVPKDDVLTKAALSVFDAAGERYSVNKGMLHVIDKESEKLAFAAITYLVSEAAKSAGVNSVSDAVVLSALEKMHTHPGDHISVRELAAAAYMNVDSFIRRFKRVMGVTPYAYLKNLRERSADLK